MVSAVEIPQKPAPDTLKEKAESKLDTLETFMWPGGSEDKPRANTSHLRLYGHNLCPFVGRARYAMAAKQLEFQEVFLDMADKGAWHKEFNGGFVPILENTDGKLFPESGIIEEFAYLAGGDKGA